LFQEEEDDLDACIDEINKVLASSAVSSSATSADGSDYAATKPLLSIEHRYI